MNSHLKIKHAYKNGITHTPQHQCNETENHKSQVSQYELDYEVLKREAENSGK